MYICIYIYIQVKTSDPSCFQVWETKSSKRSKQIQNYRKVFQYLHMTIGEGWRSSPQGTARPDSFGNPNHEHPKTSKTVRP